MNGGFGSKPVTNTFEIVAVSLIGMDAGSNEHLCGMQNGYDFGPCPSGMQCVRKSYTFDGKKYFYGECEQNEIEGGYEMEGGNDASEMRGSYGPRIVSDGEGNISTEIAI